MLHVSLIDFLEEIYLSDVYIVIKILNFKRFFSLFCGLTTS